MAEEEFLETLEKEAGFPKIPVALKTIIPAEPPYMPLPSCTKELQEKIPIVGAIIARLKGAMPTPPVKPPIKPIELPGGAMGAPEEGLGELEELPEEGLGELEELPAEGGAVEELEEKEGVVY